MTTTASIRQMVAAGLTYEQALLACEVIEHEAAAVEEARLASKRESNRERQSRRRALSRDVTAVTRDERDTPAPFLPSDKETSPTPPKETNSPLTPAPGEGAAARQRFQNPAIVLQTVLDPMTAKSWADHLAQKGKQLSGPSAEATVAELLNIRNAGGNPVEAVNLSIKKNWASIDIEYCRNAGMKFTSAAPTSIDWPTWCSAYFGGASWPHGLGPKPDEPGCKAPADVVEQARKAAA